MPRKQPTRGRLWLADGSGQTLGEAKILIERWRQEYNTFRPYSSLGYRAPAPEAVLWRVPNTTGLRSAASVALT